MDDRSDWLEMAGKIALGVGAGALAAAGVLVAKSGAVQSAEARKRRNAERRLIDAPRAGTPLLVSLGGIAEHSGVFLGRSRVAELNGNGRLMDVSLSEFINGMEDASSNMRWGTRIFAACDKVSGTPLSALRIAHRARDLIEKVGQVKYNLFGNNCHLFTASCVRGELSDGLSFSDWIKNGTFSIDRLEEVLSTLLNGGRPIAWLGVREPTRFFNYALSDSKLERLRKEGRI
ncbi:MAG: lecithin retinol acyltransferase family protein [bacterium]|nr:lecithin retinol acyltransferase family protein [bacterium]